MDLRNKGFVMDKGPDVEREICRHYIPNGPEADCEREEKKKRDRDQKILENRGRRRGSRETKNGDQEGDEIGIFLEKGKRINAGGVAKDIQPTS
ncbi:hypothetical protein TNCV_1401041 [Trichonephila clavipes]|nr:hypothetical protein TNCV_1401041 [Trichonephila clavipes]